MLDVIILHLAIYKYLEMYWEPWTWEGGGGWGLCQQCFILSSHFILASLLHSCYMCHHVWRLHSFPSTVIVTCWILRAQGARLCLCFLWCSWRRYWLDPSPCCSGCCDVNIMNITMGTMYIHCNKNITIEKFCGLRKVFLAIWRQIRTSKTHYFFPWWLALDIWFNLKWPVSWVKLKMFLLWRSGGERRPSLIPLRLFCYVQ